MTSGIDVLTPEEKLFKAAELVLEALDVPSEEFDELRRVGTEMRGDNLTTYQLAEELHSFVSDTITHANR